MKGLLVVALMAALPQMACSTHKGEKQHSKSSSEKSNVKKKDNTEDASAEQKPTDAVADPVEAADAAELALITTRVRDYEAIYNTFEVITGVNGRTTNTNGGTIYEYFSTQLASTLPTDSDPETFSSASFVSVVKLAGEFCSAAWNIRNKEFQENLLSTSSIEELSKEEISNAELRDIGNSLAKGVFGYSQEELEKSTNTVDVMVNLGSDIRDQLVDENKNANDTKRGIVVAMCSVSLASIETVLH